jgi:DnaJ-class molecular chaperone
LGNEAFGAKRSDLIVKFKQIPDKSGFVRDGDNLIFNQKVSLIDSFNPSPFTLKSLDGRTFTMTPNS